MKKHNMLRLTVSIIMILAIAVSTLTFATRVDAATAPTLGTAKSFAVLGGSTVTNTGPTVVSGDLGVSPGSAVTGFPPGIVNGTQHNADAVALQAQNDLTTAYNDLAGQASDSNLSGQDLGGMMLTTGVYTFSSSAQLTGTLTLDAQGNPDAVFIFQIGSTLTTATNSSVLLTNGASPCSVFWQVGSSATLGTTTTFVGSILALTSITLNTGATVSGRALARHGAVTMDSNTINVIECAGITCPTASLWAVQYRFGTPAPGYKFEPNQMFRSWLQVRFVNDGPGIANNVKAFITCKPVNVAVVDGQVSLGTIPAGGTAWSTDTFTLLTDMKNPQDPHKGIVWQVEYDDACGHHQVVTGVPKFKGEANNCP